MSRLLRSLLLPLCAVVAAYVGFAAWTGFGRIGVLLAGYPLHVVGLALLLASANYALRFLKWHYYLGRLGLRVPVPRSLSIFLSGFALTITPGKVGEVLKSYLLRESDGVPMARTAPIVVAERVTDLIACLCLMVAGASTFAREAMAGHPGRAEALRYLWLLGGAAIAGLLLVVAVRPLGETAIALVERLPVVGRIAPKLGEFYASTRALLGPAPLAVATLLSVAAWLAECVAFWLILSAFRCAAGGGCGSITVGLASCTFIYAAMTVAGALSFLPGGLGVQEGGMIALLIAASHGTVDEPTAFAATFLTRGCTLFYAVLVGVLALGRLQRRLRVDLADVDRLRETAARGGVKPHG